MIMSRKHGSAELLDLKQIRLAGRNTESTAKGGVNFAVTVIANALRKSVNTSLYCPLDTPLDMNTPVRDVIVSNDQALDVIRNVVLEMITILNLPQVPESSDVIMDLYPITGSWINNENATFNRVVQSILKGYERVLKRLYEDVTREEEIRQNPEKRQPWRPPGISPLETSLLEY